MSNLGVMDIFKLLPAAKKAPEGNCAKCGLKTCMMFAVKLSKNGIDAALCPHIPDELKEKLSYSKKSQQLEIKLHGSISDLVVGGEKVMCRHEKTFINPPPLVVLLDFDDPEFDNLLTRIKNFEIENIGVIFKVEGVSLKAESPAALEKIKNAGVNYVPLAEIQKLTEVQDADFIQTLAKLTEIRRKAVVDRDENFITPVFVHLKDTSLETLTAKASAYIAKYASLLLFGTFDEAVFSTLYSLRQNIFTDPEMPLQVESKVYEFNNPTPESHVFLTTNFALSYFAVANEIANLEGGAYLVITPSDGMSVLTAWSAEKITAEIAAKIINQSEILSLVRNKKLIIPGLLADLKEELQLALPAWEIVTGTVEAYKIPEFVKALG